MPQIIDNREEKLINVIKDKLRKSKRARFCSGWLFISGFKYLKDEIDKLEKLEILAGSKTNKQTAEIMLLEKKLEKAVKLSLEKNKYLPEDKRREKLEEEKNSLINEISYLELTEENKEFLEWFMQKLQERKIEIRIYYKEPMHAKLYLFENDDYKEAILGSSNFSLSGLELNTELNICLPDKENTDFLFEWFENLWKEGENADFTDLAISAIKQSWPFNTEVTPFRVYLKVLHEIFSYTESEGFEDIEFPIELYRFQKDAVIAAKKRLDIFNGVYIADVPGLGKTYIGAALLAHLETEGKNAIVIVPPRLKETWEEVLRDLGVARAKVFSAGKLEEILDNEKYLKRPVVLVDEAHHFRNPDTQHYRDLSQICRNKKVILLSATPENLNIEDIYWQLKLFTPYETNHYFRIYPLGLKDYFKKCEQGEANIEDLISQIFIRRTRSDIKEYYPDDLLQFPTRKGPYRIDYSIDEVYEGGLYQELQNLIQNLTYARYNVFKYAIQEKFLKDEQFEHLGQVWGNIQKLININLYRRLESSVKAFKDTLETYLKVNKVFYETISTQNKIPIGDIRNLAKLSESLENDEEFEWEEGENYYDANKFRLEELKSDLKKDINNVEKMLNKVKDITPDKDDKLQKLIQILQESEVQGKKIIVFSYFESTVKYLYENLKNKFEKIDYIAGGEKLLTKIKRFAPKANKVKIDPSDEIDILITTEVTSEGLNLQDGQVVINYELHWNPVRIIQRLGRIDRIGSAHEEIYVYNFFPESKAEEKIKIEQMVTKRIDEIISHFGYDEKTIGINEEVVRKKLFEIYTEKPESLKEEEIISLPGYFELQYKKLKENYPEEYKKALSLPLQINVRKGNNSKKSDELIVFCKINEYYRLMLLDKNGKMIDRNDWEILKQLKCNSEETGSPIESKYWPILIRAKELFEEEANSRERDRERITDPVKISFKKFIDGLKKKEAESIKKELDQILDLIMSKELDYSTEKEIRHLILKYSKAYAMSKKEMIKKIRESLEAQIKLLPDIIKKESEYKFAQIIVAEQI